MVLFATKFFWADAPMRLRSSFSVTLLHITQWVQYKLPSRTMVRLHFWAVHTDADGTCACWSVVRLVKFKAEGGKCCMWLLFQANRNAQMPIEQVSVSCLFVLSGHEPNVPTILDRHQRDTVWCYGISRCAALHPSSVGVAGIVSQWLWCSAAKHKVVGSTTGHSSCIPVAVGCEITFVQTRSIIPPKNSLSSICLFV